MAAVRASAVTVTASARRSETVALLAERRVILLTLIEDQGLTAGHRRLVGIHGPLSLPVGLSQGESGRLFLGPPDPEDHLQ